MPHQLQFRLPGTINGLARVVHGNALAALENVALWHERILIHSSADRIILPDSALSGLTCW